MDKIPTDIPSAESQDFTEANYRRLLELAASKYRFVTYGEEPDEPFVIWRHDVDYSPHRALAMARIEASLSLRCVYHVLISGRYYNIFEPGIAEIFRTISGLGHEVGLHFDMDVIPSCAAIDVDRILERIALEKRVVEAIAAQPVTTMSYHNYTLHEASLDRAEWICGMFNVSTRRFQGEFKYVSDSNGIWRYDRLEDILRQNAYPRLHVLTHPDWWTPEPMSPAMRLRRIVEGRARANFNFYADIMKRDGRYEALAERLGIDALPRSGDE